MIAKTLAGDLICLEGKTEEEFKLLYLEKYVKEKFRPFVSLSLFKVEDELCLMVNTHKVLPYLEDKINWSTLCNNQGAIHLIEENIDKLGDYEWKMLSRNPSALRILEKNIEKINWDEFCSNPNPECYHIIRQYPEKINWACIVRYSPMAYELMKEFMEKDWYRDTFIVTNLLVNKHCKPRWIWPVIPKLVNRVDRTWSYICMNPNLIDIVEAYPDKIDWEFLSANPAAIEILKENPDKIDWANLIINPNKEAIDLVIAQCHKKIPWSELARNVSAVPILEKNVKQLSPYCWKILCRNPEAVGLLEKFQEKIEYWDELLYNEKAGKLIQNNIHRFDKDEVFVHHSVVCPPLEDF